MFLTGLYQVHISYGMCVSLSFFLWLLEVMLTACVNFAARGFLKCKSSLYCSNQREITDYNKHWVLSLVFKIYTCLIYSICFCYYYNSLTSVFSVKCDCKMQTVWTESDEYFEQMNRIWNPCTHLFSFKGIEYLLCSQHPRRCPVEKMRLG